MEEKTLTEEDIYILNNYFKLYSSWDNENRELAESIAKSEEIINKISLAIDSLIEYHNELFKDLIFIKINRKDVWLNEVTILKQQNKLFYLEHLIGKRSSITYFLIDTFTQLFLSNKHEQKTD